MRRAALTLILAAALVQPAASAPPTVGGVEPPPGPTYEAELTKVASEAAQREMRSGLEQVEKDPTVPPDMKAELKKKLARLKLAMYSSTATLDECVNYYEAKIPGSAFTFGVRGTLADVVELSKIAGFPVPASAVSSLEKEQTRSARWNSRDGLLQITVEDHLIDPRDGKVAKKTVVLVTSLK